MKRLLLSALIAIACASCTRNDVVSVETEYGDTVTAFVPDHLTASDYINGQPVTIYTASLNVFSIGLMQPSGYTMIGTHTLYRFQGRVIKVN